MSRLPSAEPAVAKYRAFILAGAFFVQLTLALGAGAAEFAAGAYIFSDELGGFRLLSASGTGTRSDPIVVVEEFDEAVPATLVIRRASGGGPAARLSGSAPLNLVKVIANRSGRVWAGFELELQEILKRPSVYTDGLSFNQFGAKPPDVSSNRFTANERLFEPYDRIHFTDGFVDPETDVRFQVTITDTTPVAEFYLVQDPKLLSAEWGRQGRDFALVP